MQKRFSYLVIFTLMLGLMGCVEERDDTAYPRPRGYFRIDFPEKTYQVLQDDFPFSFEHPKYSHLAAVEPTEDGVNFRIHYGWYDATLWCSYHNDTNLVGHVEASHELAYKHKDIAKQIEPIPFRHDSNKVYGVEYLIKGERVATPYAFYAMDSTNRFFRASLYFDKTAYTDSLEPVLDYLQEDMKHMIQSFRWTTVN